MSLLTDLFRGEFSGSITDEYRLAAARRTASSAGPRAPGRHVVLLVVGVVILGLLFAVTAVQTRKSAPAVAAERASLVTRVQQATAETNRLKLQLTDMQDQLARAQEAALATTTTGIAVQDALDRLAGQTGATAVTGPGVRITVDNAAADPDADPATDTGAEGRVLDIDLQELVNGLWVAGAEAVAVDGVRVTARTSIRMAGDAIFMDLQPLTRPYVITAIGDPDSLAAKFSDSYGGAWMQTLAGTYGVRFDLANDDSLMLPAASSIDLDLAQPVVPGPNPNQSE